MAAIPPQTVLQAIEPQFFVDYALFTGSLRNYTARTLEDSFKGSGSDVERRFFLLGLLKEEYSAYEDLGAFLLAFVRRNRGTALPLETLLDYGVGDAYIDEIFTDFKIVTEGDLYTSLWLGRLIPVVWGTVFPAIDLDKCLHKACEFFVTDCRRNQRHYGIKAFNKIKHGGMVVPDASKYIPNLPPTPAAIFKNPDKTSPNPFVLHAVQMSDTHLEQRLRSIEFIQNNLQLLSALYVYTEYPAALKSLGFDPPHTLFQHPHFADVIGFLDQVTKSP